MKTFRLLMGLILIVSSNISLASTVYCSTGYGYTAEDCAITVGNQSTIDFRNHDWVWLDQNQSQYVVEFVGGNQVKVTYISPTGVPTLLGTYYAQLTSGSGSSPASGDPNGVISMVVWIDGISYPVRLAASKFNYSHDVLYETCLMLPGSSYYNCSFE